MPIRQRRSWISVALGLSLVGAVAAEGRAAPPAAPSRDVATWDEAVGLWAGGDGEAAGAEPVHSIRGNAWRLVAAGLDGDLDRVPAGRVLRRLREAQERDGEARGAFRWNWEDEGLHDPNGGFFTVLALLGLRLEFADRLSAADLHLIDEMLAESRHWFDRQTEPLDESRLRYPNCILGNAVCRWLLMELFDSRTDPATEAILGKTLDSLAASHWGWGEHLSDIYAKVCQAELVMLLAYARRLPPATAARAEALLAELDAIDADFAGGPRVPAIRSYALAASPATPRDRARNMFPFRDLMAAGFRRPSDVTFLLAATLAARRGVPARLAAVPAAAPRDRERLEIACHAGARALARVDESWRLGVLTRYPLMEGVDNPAWGLHWQSMPVAFHRPAGDWGFLQWLTEERGTLRALPALAKTAGGPRVLSDLHPAAAVGRTFGARRGELFLAVRRLDAVAPSWPWACDRFRILDATCGVPVASRQGGWARLDLPYADGLTLTLSYRPLDGDVTTRLESPAPGTWHWEHVHACPPDDPPRPAGLWALAVASPPAALPAVAPAADGWRLEFSDGAAVAVAAFAADPFAAAEPPIAERAGIR
jgi:hypothetical protein